MDLGFHDFFSKMLCFRNREPGWLNPKWVIQNSNKHNILNLIQQKNSHTYMYLFSIYIPIPMIFKTLINILKSDTV